MNASSCKNIQKKDLHEERVMKRIDNKINVGLQDNITPKQLAQIIRNKDKRYEFAGKDYILLIKEEANNRCMLLVSDCQEAIWMKPLDITFFINLRRQLHLTSSLQVFAQHFVNSLHISSKLQKIKIHLKIHIELQIGEGLVMSCNTFIESRVHFNNPDDFKVNLHKFIVYMWEVKSMQLKNQISKEEQEKKDNQEKEKLEKENEKSRNLFVADNKSKRISLKHRDLVNPQRKKRKKNGARLGSGFDEQRVAMQLPQDLDI